MLVNVPRLQTIMDEEGLDGLVATTLPNIHYFTGIWSLALSCFSPYDGQFYAIITRDEPTKPYVVSSTVEIDQVLDGFQIEGAIRFGTFFREEPQQGVKLTKDEKRLKDISVETGKADGPINGLVTALEMMGLVDKKIGIDELGLRPSFYDTLGENLNKAELKRSFSLLRRIRKVKTQSEIRRLRKAVEITEQAILAATAIARLGVTEDELVREFKRSVVIQGGCPRFTFIRFGRNGVAFNRDPDRTPLNKGDTIWFDTGIQYKGYWSDIARVFSFGEPSNRVSEIYRALLIGEQAGISRTRVGMHSGDLYNITMEACREAGLSHYRRNHVGHGIGAELYEPPLLAPHNQDIIEEGSVINIETPYYEFGLGALQIEEPYVVKANGNHERLSTMGRDIQIIEP